MERFILRDDHWEGIKDRLPGKETDRGVTAKDNRLFLETVFWVARYEKLDPAAISLSSALSAPSCGCCK